MRFFKWEKRRNHGGGLLLLLSLMAVLATGCFRGRPFEDPPLYIKHGMENQPKYLPQGPSAFFVDGAAMRTPVPGTVARGELMDDTEFYFGVTADGDTVKHVPIPITMKLLKRGRERYDIYCSPCHSRIGDGRGIVVQYKFLPPPSFHDERLRKVSDGYIFSVISNGIRNMPSYRHQISVADRWAIVAYVRALQRSQNASIDDLPEEIRAEYENEF